MRKRPCHSLRQQASDLGTRLAKPTSFFMALIPCRECSKPVSTEAAACPHCGAPPQRPVPPPLPVKTPPVPKEEIIYADNAVAVTSTRVVIGGTTYALRNITSVKMAFSSPDFIGPVCLLLFGAFILFLTLIPWSPQNYKPVLGAVLGGGIIGLAILLMCSLKPRYHVGIASAAGEIHALTSKDQAYVERIVLSVNEAIVKHQ